MTSSPDTNISYPVFAADYLDISGWNGNGSVAGLLDDANRIILGYDARLTYEEAKELAESMNKTKLFNEGMLRTIKGTAKEIRT
jgi:hypothetical protein